MSSSTCQGLQTCPEPRIAEPRVLRLKLAPPESPAAPTKGRDATGWSFLQCLDDVSTRKGNSVGNNEGVYVHPQAKSSASSKLSAASLAMCTESLGSESGGDDVMPLLLTLDNSPVINSHETSVSRVKKQSRRLGDVAFPPPLTSISGSGGVRVRPLREDGRLILLAVSVSPATTGLQSERSNGRLRIRSVTETEHDQEHEVHETAIGNRDIDDEAEEEEEYGEGYNGNDGESLRDKIGIESFRRARIGRCKESGKNWETHFAWLLKPICLP